MDLTSLLLASFAENNHFASIKYGVVDVVDIVVDFIEASS